MNNKILPILGIICIAIIGVAFFSYPTESNKNNTIVEASVVPQVNLLTETQQDDSGTLNIHYKGHVDIYKTTYTTGKTELVTSKSNLITNMGKEYIKQQIGNGSAVASNSTKFISLSNDASAADAGWSVIPAEITTNGLDRNATAIYQSNGTGAWNYTAVFTATASQSAQLTGLNWDPVDNKAGNLFAALTFTPQSLLVNDQLTVVWSISVS